jgi:hypothetical protein
MFLSQYCVDDYGQFDIYIINSSLTSIHQAKNCRYDLSNILIPVPNFTLPLLANDNRVLIWTLSTTLPFLMILGGIIFTITFWKYHANMIILRDIQQGMFKVKFFFKVLIHPFCTLNI